MLPESIGPLKTFCLCLTCSTKNKYSLYHQRTRNRYYEHLRSWNCWIFPFSIKKWHMNLESNTQWHAGTRLRHSFCTKYRQKQLVMIVLLVSFLPLWIIRTALILTVNMSAAYRSLERRSSHDMNFVLSADLHICAHRTDAGDRCSLQTQFTAGSAKV